MTGALGSGLSPRHLLDAGGIDPHGVFIAVATAGGYTAIRAVFRPDSPFALAAARSATIDPNRWKTTAPRF